MSLTDDRSKQLAPSFTGQLLQPTDAGYDEARRVHNGLIDKRPALIARCQGAADVADAVKLARIARTSRSRSAAAATTSPAAPRRRRPDDRPRADERHPRRPGRAHGARAGRRAVEGTESRDAGARSRHDRRRRGLDTGIAGLTLGGGLGWLMPKYGLALDNLRSAEMVLADGRVVTRQRRARTRICSGGSAAAAATSASPRRSSTTCIRSAR